MWSSSALQSSSVAAYRRNENMGRFGSDCNIAQTSERSVAALKSKSRLDFCEGAGAIPPTLRQEKNPAGDAGFRRRLRPIGRWEEPQSRNKITISDLRVWRLCKIGSNCLQSPQNIAFPSGALSKSHNAETRTRAISESCNASFGGKTLACRKSNSLRHFL